MGNQLAMALGIVFMLVGCFFGWQYWSDFLGVLRGCIGFTFLLIGLLALVIGWSERKASSEFERATAPTPPTPAPAPTSMPESDASEAVATGAEQSQ